MKGASSLSLTQAGKRKAQVWPGSSRCREKRPHTNHLNSQPTLRNKWKMGQPRPNYVFHRFLLPWERAGKAPLKSGVEYTRRNWQVRSEQWRNPSSKNQNSLPGDNGLYPSRGQSTFHPTPGHETLTTGEEKGGAMSLMRRHKSTHSLDVTPAGQRALSAG